MEFKSCYVNKPRQVSALPGRIHIEEYFHELDEKTCEDRLVVLKMRNIYEIAQQSKPKDIYELLEESGVEISSLERLVESKEYAESLLTDFTDLPTDTVGAFNVVKRAQRSFDELPLPLKAEFDNNSAKMLRSLLDNSFQSRVAKFFPQEQNKENNENKGDK